LQLLLLLSALLTGFTGMIAGDRMVERTELRQNAVAAAVETFAEVAVSDTHAILAPAPSAALLRSVRHIAPAQRLTVPAPLRVNESRLE